MEVQKLFTTAGTGHGWKVMVAAEYVGSKMETEFVSWEQTKEASFLANNPNGKVPVVMTSKGPLFESHAILRTLARAHPEKKAYGKNIFEQAKVDQWLDWVAGEYTPALYGTVAGVTGWKAVNQKAFDEALEAQKKKLQVVEEHLANSQFLVGDTVTIADLSLVCMNWHCVGTIFDAEFRKGLPNFFNWFHAMASLPAVAKVLGRARYCEKKWPLYVAPEPKKEEKKVAEKPASKPKKKDDDDDEEEEEKPKKDEAKSELESLPPSPFNFYDFKTLISNATNKADAVAEFWKQFDKDGYSLWFVEYEKAAGEGKVVYITNNLMNGFLQRLDHFRRYCYGVYGVYGDEPNLEVRGVFCWRGTKIPLMIKEHDQYDYHRFTQLDPTKEADKKKVEEFWTKLKEDEDVVDGMMARTVKPFK